MKNSHELDLSERWQLPEHYHVPINDSIFRLCIFENSDFQPLAEMIRGMLEKRPNPPDSVLVRFELGVAADVMPQLYRLFGELLPGVNVCFEAAYPKKMLIEHLIHINKMFRFYRCLLN